MKQKQLMPLDSLPDHHLNYFIELFATKTPVIAGAEFVKPVMSKRNRFILLLPLQSMLTTG